MKTCLQLRDEFLYTGTWLAETRSVSSLLCMQIHFFDALESLLWLRLTSTRFWERLLRAGGNECMIISDTSLILTHEN